MHAAFAPCSSEAVTCRDPVRLTPIELTHDTAAGVWFSEPDANHVLFLLETCLPAERTARAAAEAVVAQQRDLVVTSSKTAAVALQLAGEEATRADRWKTQAESQPTGLLSSGTFWFAVGVTAGVAATIGVLAATKAIKEGL